MGLTLVCSYPLNKLNSKNWFKVKSLPDAGEILREKKKKKSTNSTSKKTLYWATYLNFYSFPTHRELLMLTDSYMNAATMQNTHHTALFCPAHSMEVQRPVLPALLWNKASAGPAPWEMLFCNDELPSVGKRRTTAGSGSSPAHCSFSPWCIQIPPRTSSLLLYLDGHQSACCSSRGEAALLEPA